ncbi:MAG: hypothetical protein ACOYJE_10450 [Bacteroidaceae bacterium]
MQDILQPVRQVVSQFCAHARLQLLPQPEQEEEVEVLSQLPEQLLPQSEHEDARALPLHVSLHVSLHESLQLSLQLLRHPEPHPPCAEPTQLLLQLDPQPPRAVPTQELPQSMGGVSSSPQPDNSVGPRANTPKNGKVRLMLARKNSRRVIFFSAITYYFRG